MRKALFTFPIILYLLKFNLFAAIPVIYFSDITDGPVSGWEDSSTKGAAISIWGNNFGTTRNSSYVTVSGINLQNDSDYAEWAATSNPITARGMQRITFWLNSSMNVGSTVITVTTSEGTSNTIPFYCRDLGSNRIVFISRDGSDSNNGLFSTDQGAQNGPWFSANTVRGLQPGDICYFRSGIWDEIDNWECVIDFWSNNHNNGTENNSISIASYPTELAQLGSSSTPYVIRHHGSQGDILNYWTFSKFRMRSSGNTTNWSNADQPGSSTNNRFIANDVSTTAGGRTALVFAGQGNGSNNLRVYGNYVCDCGVDNRGETAAARGYGIYINGYGTLNNVFIGWNEFAYNSNGRGMQIYGHEVGDKVDTIYVHDNYIHHNGLTGAVLGGGDPTEDYSFLNVCYFYNNLVFLNGYGGEYDYPAILMGGENGGGNDGEWYIYNNTLYNNCAGEVHVSGGSSPVSIVMKNNIIVSDDGQSYYTGLTGSFFSGSNNCYFNSGSGPSWDSDRLDDENPDFIVSEPSSLLEFQIQENSSCKDRGTITVNDIVKKDIVATYRPQGTAFDIGAFEYYEGFQPLDITEPDAIVDLNVIIESDKTVTISFTASGDDGNTGNASYYDIRYNTVEITNANWNNSIAVTGEPTPQSPGTLQSFSFSGLTPGRVYYFAMKVMDEVSNQSNLSNNSTVYFSGLKIE